MLSHLISMMKGKLLKFRNHKLLHLPKSTYKLKTQNSRSLPNGPQKIIDYNHKNYIHTTQFLPPMYISSSHPPYRHSIQPTTLITQQNQSLNTYSRNSGNQNTGIQNERRQDPSFHFEICFRRWQEAKWLFECRGSHAFAKYVHILWTIDGIQRPAWLFINRGV